MLRGVFVAMHVWALIVLWLLCTGERVQIHSSMTIHYHSFLRDEYQRASLLIP